MLCNGAVPPLLIDFGRSFPLQTFPINTFYVDPLGHQETPFFETFLVTQALGEESRRSFFFLVSLVVPGGFFLTVAVSPLPSK